MGEQKQEQAQPQKQKLQMNRSEFYTRGLIH